MALKKVNKRNEKKGYQTKGGRSCTQKAMMKKGRGPIPQKIDKQKKKLCGVETEIKEGGGSNTHNNNKNPVMLQQERGVKHHYVSDIRSRIMNCT